MINNYNDRQSSCYFLDIRNSTSLVRTISLTTNNGRSDPKKTADANRLKIHAEFMLDIHNFLFEKLAKLKITDYYFNNTGDGHVCLLWNKTHAWAIIDISCSLSNYLENRIKEYYDEYLIHWSEEYKKDLSLGFGLGIHSGGSIITQQEETKTKFAFGIVLNSGARTESFTKNFPSISFLFTKNFISQLKKQFKYLKSKEQWRLYESKIRQVTMFPVDIKDSRSGGHLLYTLKKEDRQYFIGA